MTRSEAKTLLEHVEIPASAIDRLRSAKRVAVLTGAGISAESGVPTFRGADGLWRKFRPEELASLEAFMNNPELVWEWYQYRRRLIDAVTPNPGHHALAQMENAYPDFCLITQNVDGLHQRAGSGRVVELHGNILRNRCLSCGRISEEDLHLEAGQVPTCQCTGLLRPDVVWFGEFLPEAPMRLATAAAQQCDLFIAVGTSGVVYPAASLPEMARQSGAFLLEVNIEPSAISAYADEIIIAKSGETLPHFLTAIRS